MSPVSDPLSHLRDTQNWLKRSGLGGIVIPSTDEFLSEFPPPPNRRLCWTTGFRGSTGTAVILQDHAAIFLDGRYFLQGSTDTAGTGIAVEPTTLESRREWLKRSLRSGARLGLDPWLHSSMDIAQWRGLASELGFELEMLRENPIDPLWSVARPAAHQPRIVDYPVRYAGETYEAKCRQLMEHVKAAGLQALLIADPEDVSWLLNVRAADETVKTAVGEWHVVPSCTSRALVRRDGITWFVDEERLAPEVLARDRQLVRLAPPDALAAALRDIAQKGPIGAHLNRAPAALVDIISGKVVPDDTVARRRWRKHKFEIESARRAHIIDAAAVVRFMAWLARTVPERPVTEFEAAQMLESLRAEHPQYKGPSMPLMSASGPSAALPHYVPPREGSRRLNDHPIYWMDSGGQYPGGSTDNTITLAVGAPEAKHILAHTLVLQGFIALATTRIPKGTTAQRLDPIARQPLWREGMDYAHGTGHGVGNYLNIHEGPVMRPEPTPVTLVAFEPGMIVTNEPGYYAADDFGLRIESHMVVVESSYPGFLEFDLISRLPIDPRLVDFGRLSALERRWLRDYHQTVLRDLEPLLEGHAAEWLRGIVDSYG